MEPLSDTGDNAREFEAGWPSVLEPQPDMLGDEFPEPPRRGQYPIPIPELPRLSMTPALTQMREMLEGIGKAMRNPAPGDVVIPPAIGHVFHICSTCHRWYWTRDRYRGHWLLVHWHKLGMD